MNQQKNPELINLTVTDPESYSYFLVDNVLSDEEIRFLINSVEINEGRLNPGLVGSGLNGGYNPKIRRSLVSWFDPNDKSIAFFYTKIVNSFREVNQNFFRYSLTGLEQTQFTKYTENDSSYYDWHKDEEPTGFKHIVTRKLSSVLFLSDPQDYNGGELLICNSPENIITVEPKKSRMVFFPSFTIHKVNPVTKGVRYTAVNWARGPGFL